MNTSHSYRRHDHRALPHAGKAPTQQTASPELTVEALAAHRDPSLPVAAGVPEHRGTRSGVAWVRPTELASLVGSRVAGRGIDVQADLARRACRAPIGARAVRRAVRTQAGLLEVSSSTPGTQRQSDGVSL